jgi:hypothetical protein
MRTPKFGDGHRCDHDRFMLLGPCEQISRNVIPLPQRDEEAGVENDCC